MQVSQNILITSSDSLRVDATSTKLLPEDVPLEKNDGTTTVQESESASGINLATGDVDGSTKIYDVSGNRIYKLQKGLNIIKMSDGTTKKVLVK